jgi:hypothetical protein
MRVERRQGIWRRACHSASQPGGNAYSVNNITAKKDADGSVNVQFGGCHGKIPNCIPIMKGWNAAIRMYRPRPEILSGKWKFPEPQAVN